MTPQYEMLMDLLHRRMSVRKLKSDPLPEGAIEKILEAGRWAMSGANGQPWEYIVVTDPTVKQRLFKHYQDELNSDYNFWMEQMRVPELRHPAFQLAGEPEEQIRTLKSRSWLGRSPCTYCCIRRWASSMGYGDGWPYFWPPPITPY